MTELKFNERNQAYVPFSEFNAYMTERNKEGNYIKENDSFTFYFNGEGQLIGKYSNYQGMGEIYRGCH